MTLLMVTLSPYHGPEVSVSCKTIPCCYLFSKNTEPWVLFV